MGLLLSSPSILNKENIMTGIRNIIESLNETQLASLRRKTEDAMRKDTNFLKDTLVLAITDNKITNVEEVINGQAV